MMLQRVDQVPDFDIIADRALDTVRDSSKATYAFTYREWALWCEARNLEPIQLLPEHIRQFLVEQPVTLNTRRVHLSALRKLAWVLALDFRNPAFRALYEYLLSMRVPDEGVAGMERNKVALSPGQVHRILTFYITPELFLTPGDIKNAQLRNHLALCAALALGARRAELVKLEWRDINEDDGTAIIRHGKRGKERTVAFVGDFALTPLRLWRERVRGYRYLFVPVNKADRIGEDQPINGNTLYRLVKDVSTELGFDFATHDFRRTLITELHQAGANLRDIQAQAGHANEATTLRYVQATDAKGRRERFRTRWE